MDSAKAKYLREWIAGQLPRAFILALAMLGADIGTTYIGFALSPYAHEINPIYNWFLPLIGPTWAWVPTIANGFAQIAGAYAIGSVFKTLWLKVPTLALLWTTAAAHAYAAFVFNVGSILAYLAWASSHAR